MITESLNSASQCVGNDMFTRRLGIEAKHSRYKDARPISLRLFVSSVRRCCSALHVQLPTRSSALIWSTGLCLALLLILPACTTTYYVAEDFQNWDEIEWPPDTSLAYQVFLIGDAGKPNLDGPTPTLELLKNLSRKAGKESAIVHLGDNLYCCGLPRLGGCRAERIADPAPAGTLCRGAPQRARKCVPSR